MAARLLRCPTRPVRSWTRSASGVKSPVRIGGASGFWGDSTIAAPQLLAPGTKLNYLVFDYLAETTLAIMSRMREKNPDAGYATDFVEITMKQIAPALKAGGVKVISNAGGINPLACKAALEEALKAVGVELKVGVVLGDEILDRSAALRDAGVREMFSDEIMPEGIKSSNAYLGARPIATLLDQGCDVVITGRCVDSAVTLGACMHAFDWEDDQYNELAGATIAGHIIECGAQGTGGLFTDWKDCASWVNIGYPIAEVEQDGSFTISKPEKTDGLICVGAVAEQLLYEVGDPGAYHVPDVACDMTHAKVEQVGMHRVRVSNVKGQPPTDTYKVTATYFDGWRNSAFLVIGGDEAELKAQRTGEAIFARTSAMLAAANLANYSETVATLSY